MRVRSTTVLAVRRGGKASMAADGQVTVGNTIVKQKAKKVRRLYEGKVLSGFAGSGADAVTLFDRLEGKLSEFGGNLTRAAVELAKEWRTDRVLRRLDAMLIAMDDRCMFLISGSGDVIEPDGDAIAIGSGGPYAVAAARALLAHTKLSAPEIARESLRIASDICIYTNPEIVVEDLS